ncbi:2698_t:CDS:2 [Cetraspora pellucida]|uniref:2698_t:CDS:1 n=1 Tax=Cetraspora pellucida TaxID=1433469 RepID=A0A9N8W0X4_9GLOM|nr:2698_t:CDS:2 [Cetraspora pellucida]
MEKFLRQIDEGFLKKFDYEEFENIKKNSDGSNLIESAFWRKKRRHVVLKFLKENCEDKYYKKLLREIRNIKKVDDDANVIKFYGVTKDPSKEFYSMVFHLYNKTLREYLKDVSKQDWHSKLKMAKDIANGLNYIHAENVIHCDLVSILFFSSSIRPFGKNIERLQSALLDGTRENPINLTPVDYKELYCDAWSNDSKKRPLIEDVINLLRDIELDCVYKDCDYIPEICLGKIDTSISKKEACLMVIKGSPQNKYFFLSPDETLIGRKNSNHIIIRDQEIAKIHANIKNFNGKVDITNLSSGSGIVINGEELLFHDSRNLKRDDMIKMGRCTFQYLPAGEYESRIDKLLPIYNVGYLKKCLENEFLNARENKQKLSLLFFDLDNFKSINDGNNHEAGDYALKELAELIQNHHRIRAEDIFARYGGDEFTILLKNTDIKLASEIAEEIRVSVEAHSFTYREKKLPVTLSIGVTGMDPSVETYNKLLNHADEALKKAKEYGRNNVAIWESENDIEHLKNVQQLDLKKGRGEMLSELGELNGLKNRYLEDLNEICEFREALALYVEPRGKWNVPVIMSSAGKEEMGYKEREGDIEKVVRNFLTSRHELISDDKKILENVSNECFVSKEIKPLIETVNRFFTPENQLTLEDINVLKVATNQFLALKDQKAWKLLEMAMNEFLESSKRVERVLKNTIRKFLESPLVLEDKLILRSKLDLVSHITKEDVITLEKASKNKKEFKITANRLLNLKAKEVLEAAVNRLLNEKRKKVLLILGSGGTGKSTFNRYLARNLWEEFDNQKMMQPLIPLFIALAPLEGLINQDQDFIEAYLQKEGKLSTDQIDILRERKFVFILDGYDEIAERERHCYNKNKFSKWKNAKIIISCRPEYLGKDYEKRFWPTENEGKGFQELTITPFSPAEIEKYTIKYVDYSQDKGIPLTWDAKTYIQQIKNMPQVQDLVTNPILLKITLNVLPKILGEKEITTSQINRIVLYDEFIKQWFERAQNRLLNIQLNPKERDEFNRLNEEDFSKHCLQFGNKDVECRLMRFSMPLIRRGNQYWFFHKTLRDYLIACALLDSSKNKNTSEKALFNKQSIMPEPAIQQFLVERIQQKPELKQQMLNFIECSKKNANIQIASVNAITVLMRAKIQLPTNLNNIRVPGADLSNGVFNNSQLVRANLNNVNFQNAKLRNVNLEGASLQNANLKGADLTGANLRYTNLQGANFLDSYLKNVNFEGVNLRVQDFRGFDLRNTDFCGTYF